MVRLARCPAPSGVGDHSGRVDVGDIIAESPISRAMAGRVVDAGVVAVQVQVVDQLPAQGHDVEIERRATVGQPATQTFIDLHFGVDGARLHPQGGAGEEDVTVSHASRETGATPDAEGDDPVGELLSGDHGRQRRSHGVYLACHLS